MTSTSTRPSSRAVLATIAMAVFVGALAGLVAALLAPAAVPPAGDGRNGVSGGGADGPDGVQGTGEVLDPIDPRTGGRKTGTGRVRRKRKGGQAERQELANLLSSTDPDVRYGEARAILLRGPSQLRLLSRLRPPTDAGRKLVATMREALETLRLQQRAPRHAGLMEDKQRELQLAALRKVVPDRYLARERAEYWAAKVVGDRVRLTHATIDEGELLMAEAQRDLARRELGQISETDYRATVSERLEAIAAWVNVAKTKQPFLGARGQELVRQLDALRR